MTAATLIKKAFNLGRAYSFRVLAHYRNGGRHDRHSARAVAESYILICRQRKTLWVWHGLLNLRAHSQDTLLAAWLL